MSAIRNHFYLYKELSTKTEQAMVEDRSHLWNWLHLFCSGNVLPWMAWLWITRNTQESIKLPSVLTQQRTKSSLDTASCPETASKQQLPKAKAMINLRDGAVQESVSSLNHTPQLPFLECDGRYQRHRNMRKGSQADMKVEGNFISTLLSWGKEHPVMERSC